MLNPNSPQVETITNLFIWSLVIAGIIFAIVTGLVLYFSFRYRARPGGAEPRQVQGNTKLEIGWTAAPVLILAVIFVFTIIVMRAVDPVAAGEVDRSQPPEPDIIVTGYQWWWKVEYPKSGIVTANELHIPVGRPLLIQLESFDVIHAFAVNELVHKRDMVPGHTNFVTLQADRAGTYWGACYEYCGTQHALMRFLVIAEEPDEFAAWEQQQQEPPTIPTSGDAAQGAQLFRDLACVNCHAVENVSDAQAAPDLTHLFGRQTLGAGVIENNRENLAEWIAHPTRIKPGVYMPGYELADEEMRALIAYMETLK
jgi:cytochrome c oxidase subunit 2